MLLLTIYMNEEGFLNVDYLYALLKFSLFNMFTFSTLLWKKENPYWIMKELCTIRRS